MNSDLIKKILKDNEMQYNTHNYSLEIIKGQMYEADKKFFNYSENYFNDINRIKDFSLVISRILLKDSIRLYFQRSKNMDKLIPIVDSWKYIAATDSYIKGLFSLNNEVILTKLNGIKYDDLPPIYQRWLNDYEFNIICYKM